MKTDYEFKLRCALEKLENKDELMECLNACLQYAREAVWQDALEARLEYLTKGGKWQVNDVAGNIYVEGFEDAMRCLGLRP